MKKVLCKKSKAALEGLSSQSLGAIVGIIAAAALLGMLYLVLSKNNVITLKEGLFYLSSEVTALFNGSSGYEDLTNDIVIDAKIVPDNLQKGNALVNPFGGDITLSPSSDGSSFFIEVTGIPDKECIQLGGDQASSWKSVTVNNTELSKDSPAKDIVGLCTNGDDNTLKFESR